MVQNTMPPNNRTENLEANTGCSIMKRIMYALITQARK